MVWYSLREGETWVSSKAYTHQVPQTPPTYALYRAGRMLQCRWEEPSPNISMQQGGDCRVSAQNFPIRDQRSREERRRKRQAGETSIALLRLQMTCAGIIPKRMVQWGACRKGWLLPMRGGHFHTYIVDWVQEGALRQGSETKWIRTYSKPTSGVEYTFLETSKS